MKLKTRTNQPVYYKLPVSSNMEQLSDGLLNSLKVGDVVQKKTGNQKHCYIVSYKEEKKGICLTYVDGSGYMESISYDYTGGHWVYNSKDVTHALKEQSMYSVYGNLEDDLLTLHFPQGMIPLSVALRITDGNNHVSNCVLYFDLKNHVMEINNTDGYVVDGLDLDSGSITIAGQNGISEFSIGTRILLYGSSDIVI